MLCDSMMRHFIQFSCNSCEIMGLNNHILQPHLIGHRLLDLYPKQVSQSLLFVLPSHSFQQLGTLFLTGYIIL
jgi:hypothetical protein